MSRFIEIAYRLETFSDTIVTLLVASTITLGAHETLAIIASCLAIIYWVPKIKREISINYKNSLWKYIKNLFKGKGDYGK